MGRRLDVALGLTALLLASAAVDAGARSPGTAPTATLTVSATPNDAGTRAKPNRVRIRLVHAIAGATVSTNKIEVHFPSEVLFGGQAFAWCTLDVLNDGNDDTQCAPRTVVGAGDASFTIGPYQMPASLTVYNGPKGKTMLIRFVSGAPASFDRSVAAQVIASGAEGHGRKVVITFPEELQTTSGQSIILNRLSLDLTGREKVVRRDGRREYHTYLGLGPCPDRVLAFASVTTLDDRSDPVRATRTARCDP